MSSPLLNEFILLYCKHFNCDVIMLMLMMKLLYFNDTIIEGHTVISYADTRSLGISEYFHFCMSNSKGFDLLSGFEFRLYF